MINLFALLRCSYKKDHPKRCGQCRGRTDDFAVNSVMEFGQYQGVSVTTSQFPDLTATCSNQLS